MSIERIHIVSVAPWITTAYGIQCGLLALELRKLGYHVSISAVAGHSGSIRKWKGMTVYPSGSQKYAGDTLLPDVTDSKADLALLLFDSFALDARIVDALPCRAAYWCPVDAYNADDGLLPFMYRATLQLAPRAVPIAMSRWAEAMFRASGHDDVLYIPHMIDTDIFRPMDRDTVRSRFGLPLDSFVISMNSANNDQMRKNYPGQFAAFRQLLNVRPDALLLIHADPVNPGGHLLEQLAAYYKVQHAIKWADRTAYVRGQYTAEDLAAWYNAADLHTQCSMGEGFGIPLIEAQACGIPVVTTQASAMTELCGAGWTIPGEPFFLPLLYAEHCLPPRALIARRYKSAAANPATLAALAPKARRFAEHYAIPDVMTAYWKPALDALESAK